MPEAQNFIIDARDEAKLVPLLLASRPWSKFNAATICLETAIGWLRLHRMPPRSEAAVETSGSFHVNLSIMR